MPAGFRRYHVDKNLRNVCHSVVTYIRFSYVNDHEDIFLKPTGSILLENTLNLRPITLQLIPCYTPKMAIVS